MLSSFRTNLKRWTWVLWAVIITMAAGLVIVYGTIQQGPGSTSDAVGTVNGVNISYRQFMMERRNLIDRYRQIAGENFDQFSASLDFDDMAWNNLVQRSLLESVAREKKLTVTNTEVRETIYQQPWFHNQNGVFEKSYYLQLLRRNQQTAEAYEDDIRADLRVQKARDLYLDTLVVSREEVLADYKRKNERVTINYALFQPSTYESQVTSTEEEITARFNQDPSKYVIPTKVRMSYVYITASAIAASLTSGEDELQVYYHANAEKYVREEEVRASHILVSVAQEATNDQVAAARATADELLSQAKGGADFAELAKAHSADTGSAQSGGDLGFFGRGRMVKPFEEAAFSLPVGEISEPIRSQFGFHIIKVTDKKPEGQETFEEARSKVDAEWKNERAQHFAQQRIASLSAATISSAEELRAVASANSMEVKDSPLFSEAAGLTEIPNAPSIKEWAFKAKVGDFSGPLDIFGMGTVFAVLTERVEEHPAQLEEVREDISKELLKEKTSALAEAKAKAFHEKAAAKPVDWDLTVLSESVEGQTSRAFARGEFLPGIGADAEFHDVVFGQKVGDVGPLAQLKNTNWIVYKLASRDEPDLKKFEETYPELQRTVLQTKQNTFFQQVLDELKKGATIVDHRERFGIKKPEQADQAS